MSASRAVGADRHLAKPLSAEALLDVMGGLLDPERSVGGEQ